MKQEMKRGTPPTHDGTPNRHRRPSRTDCRVRTETTDAVDALEVRTMRHDDYPTDDRVVERAENYDEQLDVETQEFYTFDHDEDEAWENAQRHHPYLREDEL